MSEKEKKLNELTEEEKNIIITNSKNNKAKNKYSKARNILSRENITIFLKKEFTAVNNAGRNCIVRKINSNLIADGQVLTMK